MIKRLFKFLLGLILSCSFIICSINFYMIFHSSNKMIEFDSTTQLEDIDAIIVLGCGLKTIETPSDMLAQRLDKGIELYYLDISDKLLMSGDNSGEYHDEVNVMKNYAINEQVPSENILLDHEGFSTYESMYRAKHIYNLENVVIVTQQYHLYRAVYVANALGMNAYGISSDSNEFSGISELEKREFLARIKDFFYTIIQPEPSLLDIIQPINDEIK